MSSDQISRLTDSQRAYLRLVLKHCSSKEIAQEFDISAHTVDKRIKEAMRILGVGSRIEAARILASAEGTYAEQQLGPQSLDLASPHLSLPNKPWASGGIGSGERNPGFDTYDDQHVAAWRMQDGESLVLPLPLFARPRHKLSIWQRAGWIIGLIIALALAAGIFLSALMAVSALINSAGH